MMAPARQKALMNILWEEQERKGHVSEDALKRISVEQDVPISRLYGVVKFYSMFRTEPQGKHVIEICGSPSCVLNDGVSMEKFLEKELAVKIGSTTKDRKFSLYKTSCIGCCDEAPAMLVDGKPYTKLTTERVKELVAKLRKK
ncbi:MAG: NAD(P)H-dependent oxidoreductase subunit E [Candidatus Micrarchaeia archaeon]|jgi:NADH:ubiquinone oxidoreductase subunit E